MKVDIENLTSTFNTQVLPRVYDGITSQEFSDFIADAKLPYKYFWVIALEEVGYLRRDVVKTARQLFFTDDPAMPGRKKPLHRADCALAWSIIKKRREAAVCKHLSNLQARNTEAPIQEPDEITEAGAIALLKSLGYRIMRPTTTYEEV